MKSASCKKKGRLLQQKVRDKLLKAFPELSEDDIRSTSMGAGGEDVTLSLAARQLIPVSIECKKLAKFSVYKFWDQAGANAGDHQPLVVIEADRRKPLAIVDFDYLISLLVEKTK